MESKCANHTHSLHLTRECAFVADLMSTILIHLCVSLVRVDASSHADKTLSAATPCLCDILLSKEA